ncbi:MAG: mechanosensitive ion channel domain-containing protein [Pseudomonadota bacterium]
MEEEITAETPTEPQELGETVEKITQEANSLAAMLGDFVDRLSTPVALNQLFILLGLIVASYLLKLVMKPPLRTYFANAGYGPATLRLFVVLTQRLDLWIFAILAWGTYLVMQQVTWPSRSFFIGIAASIATAWLVIEIVSRLIHNRALRTIVRSLAWAYAFLQIVGFWDATARILDEIRIENGNFRISLLMVLTAIVSVALLMVIANIGTRQVSGRIRASDDIDPSIKVLLTKVVQILFYVSAFLIALNFIGFDLANLAILTGAIGLGLGFGLQKIVSNLVSGFIILLDKSIKPGDVISLGETFGWITQLGARYASITTRDGREYLVPNEDFITSQVINWSHSSDFVRLDIDFGVAYDSDPYEVRKVAKEAAGSVERVLGTPSPVCHIINFGDSSIDFRLRFWIKDPTGGLTNIRGNVYLALWDALKENQIDIPFPHRDITIVNEAKD